jgi:hypothetical protein
VYRTAVLRANRLTGTAALSPGLKFHILRHTYASLCIAASRTRSLAVSHLDTAAAAHLIPTALAATRLRHAQLGPAGEVERATGIEPALLVWKTRALPLSYARNAQHHGDCTVRPWQVPIDEIQLRASSCQAVVSRSALVHGKRRKTAGRHGV